MIRACLQSCLLGLAFWLCLTDVHAALNIGIGVNFTGSTYGVNSAAQPSDAAGAAGLQHFVEFINGSFSVYDKTTGTQVLTMTDTEFWASNGVQFAPGFDSSNPRIIFDKASGRWFAAQIDATANADTTNRFLLAVSITADPTSGWKAVAFPSDISGTNFADFPTLGVNAVGVYLGAVLYPTNATATNSVGMTLVSIPKSDLLAPVPTVANRSSFGVLKEANYGYILQPVVAQDSGDTNEIVLAVAHSGDDLLPHFTLRAATIRDAAGPTPATLTAPTSIPVAAYSIPLNPFQPDGLDDLDDGDSRFSASVYQVGDIIYAVHSDELASGTAVHWYRLNALDYSVVQSGTVSDTNLDFFYPCIAANTNGVVVIGFNGSSTNTFVSCYAVAGETINGKLTFGSPILLKAGVANYTFPDPATGTTAWGDYSAITVDPIDSSRFWTIQTYASGNNEWSTHVSELKVTSSVNAVLSLSRNGTDAIVSWPTVASNFHLEFADVLTSTNTPWIAASQTTLTNGGLISVTMPVANGQRFFRLQGP